MKRMQRGMVLGGLAALGLWGCGVGKVSADRGATVGDAEEDVSIRSGYFLLESTGGPYTLSRANGGKLLCPDGHKATTCTVDHLDLPADCGWECQDGLLSLRGVTLLRGALATSGPALEVEAGFDTYRQGLGSHPLYRLTPGSGSAYQAVVLNSASSRAVPLSAIDFSHADDVNYQLDPQLGLKQLARPEGLLATGTYRRGVFTADRIFREWTPAIAPACDVHATAVTYALHDPPPEGEINLEFATVAEAERYQDPKGQTVNWLVDTGPAAPGEGFTSGRNDLWAQTFVVDGSTCQITVTGEH